MICVISDKSPPSFAPDVAPLQLHVFTPASVLWAEDRRAGPGALHCLFRIQSLG